MNFRTISIAVIVALIALLAAFNWNALAAPTPVSFGVTEIQAPLGVLMLGVLDGMLFAIGLSILALVLVARKASYPQALMKPYRKGER